MTNENSLRNITLLQGDCREVLKTLPDSSVNMCCTSPPYFGLRSYGMGAENGEIGTEKTPQEYVDKLVAVFREVKRVLRDDGTLWLNLGDSYVSSPTGGLSSIPSKMTGGRDNQIAASARPDKSGFGLSQKQLIGIPWRVAFALQADGWYLRQDIIWHKPNPMPESVTDRCTKAHEYIFLLSKSAKYYFDNDAIKETASYNTHERQSRAKISHKCNPDDKKNGIRPKNRKYDPGSGNKNNPSFDAAMAIMPEYRNKRSVWTVTTKPYKGAHFATFPAELITPCILAGCPVGGTVLDPFGGSGTTAQVSENHGRKAIMIELNPAYIKLQKKRTEQIILL